MTDRVRTAPLSRAGTLDRLLESLAAETSQRGREFEQVCKWFLENDPVYRTQVEKVWLWKDWPGRWGPDAGIDLVARDRQGHLWAIQAKAYSTEKSVTKRDIDTFLSESSRPDFAFRLLIATTDHLSSNARRTLEAQEKPVSLLLRSDIDAAPVTWPPSPSALGPSKTVRKRPRPHQRRAIKAVMRGLATNDRGILVLPCGTGKTLTSLFIAEALQSRRTLVLVPSLSLLAQTLSEWVSNARSPFDLLAVCSDDTVTSAERADSSVAHTSSLGIPVTTASHDIARFIRRRATRSRVIFATYQSSPRIAEAMRQARVPRFDLAIADEAHRCAGPVSSDFATILDSTAIRVRRRLFMTATPRYFTGRIRRAASDSDFEIASMDDEEIFGPVLHRLTFAQAIEQQLLTDYQVAIIGVDDATYRHWATSGQFVTTDGKHVTDARTLAAQIGVAKSMRRFNLQRVITFHSRVAAGKRFSNELPQVIEWMPARARPRGSLTSDYISGAMTVGERSIRLRRLRLPDTDRSLLANSRCLTEGIDVPALDAVAFIDPRRSEVDIVQAVGRAIRLSPDKKIGTIVLPVYIGDGQDAAATLDSSEFKPIWDVLIALRSHDQRLAEELDELRIQIGRKTAGAVLTPSKIIFYLPKHVSRHFATALRIRIVERTTQSWEQFYGALLSYVDREGSARPVKEYLEGDIKLGSWVAAQRMRRNRLSPDQQARLEALPGWTWNTRESAWSEGMRHLNAYVLREGHARVPGGHVEGGFNLGRWLITQRFHRAQLSAERQSLLAALPGWSWDLHQDTWDNAYDALLAYVTRESHARVPDTWEEAGVRLGRWVVKQRSKRNQLSADRVARLDIIPGWSWRPHADWWEDGFNALVSFAEREGTAVVPPGHIEDGIRLGQWASVQRDNRSTMSRERSARLEAVPEWTWQPAQDKWDFGYAKLEVFLAREGHARVPKEYIEVGYKLGSWVSVQRRRQTRIEPDRRAKLESLPGWTWNTDVELWEAGYASLQRYVGREGHANVPYAWIEANFSLGHWVSKQRSRRAALTSDRTARLAALQGWKWDARQ